MRHSSSIDSCFYNKNRGLHPPPLPRSHLRNIKRETSPTKRHIILSIFSIIFSIIFSNIFCIIILRIFLFLLLLLLLLLIILLIRTLLESNDVCSAIKTERTALAKRGKKRHK